MVARASIAVALTIAVCMAGSAVTAQTTTKKKPPPTRQVPQTKKPDPSPPVPQTKVPAPKTKEPVKPPAVAQPKKPAAERAVVQGRSTSLIIMGGAGIPLSKAPLTDFWRYGPNFSLEFVTTATRRLSLGVGADLTVLRFSYAGFAGTYPSGPPPLDRKVIWWDLYLLGRYVFFPKNLVTPYATLKIGAMRPTPASFKQVVDSVKITYYDIHARARLAAAVSGGVDFTLSSELAFVAEVNAVLVHNDPAFGSAVSLRGGFRITW
jgi:hypothetical protein